LNSLETKIEAASAPPLALRQELKEKAMRTAQLAVSLK